MDGNNAGTGGKGRIMQIKYTFIHFVLTAEKPKTSVYDCISNRGGDILGEVAWYPTWRQYCFQPDYGTVFSRGCMEDINHFIRQLEEIRTAKGLAGKD